MVLHERPGVYVEYDISGGVRNASRNRVAAIVAQASGNGIIEISSEAAAVSAFGDNQIGCNMARLLLAGGASSVLLYPVSAFSQEVYVAGAQKLLAEKRAVVLVMDYESNGLYRAIGQLLEEEAIKGNPCLGIVGLSEENVDGLLRTAGIVDCQRIVLVGGTTRSTWNELSGGGHSAAAIAGLLCGETDPALPISGAELKGLVRLEERWTEDELDRLIRGGVTPLETVGSIICPVRGITTKLTEGGAETTQWRDLEVVRVVDEVIPGVQNMLRSRFTRKKNNETTRGAIRSAVAMALEEWVRQEIIDGYGEITASADSDHASVCNVSFSFTVVHGLQRIILTAHISV